MGEIIKEIIGYWPIVFLIIVTIGTFGINKIVNKKLYRQDGTLIYVTRDDCERTRDNYQVALCSKIDELKHDVQGNKDTVLDMFKEVKTILHESDEKREKARQEYIDLAIKVAKFEARKLNGN